MAKRTTLTLDQVFNEFIYSVDRSLTTRNNYSAVLKSFFGWLAVHVKIGHHVWDATEKDMIDFKMWLQTSRRQSTTRQYLTVIKLFYAWAESKGYLDNITHSITIPKSKARGLKRALTEQQSQSLLAVIPKETITGLRDYAMINLFLVNGIRLVEACRMDITDFFDKRHYIHIQGKGMHDKSDWIKIHPKTLEAIENYLALRKNPEIIPLFCSHSPQNPGARLTPKYLSVRIRNYLDAIGLTKDMGYSAHSLRHTMASLCRKHNIPIDEISTKLRHTSLAITQIYIHYIDQEMKLQDKPGQMLENLIYK